MATPQTKVSAPVTPAPVAPVVAKTPAETWQAKQQNLEQQYQALQRLQTAAKENVAAMQSGYDTSSKEGLQNIRYTSGAAMAAQRGRNPMDVQGARQTALSRGATEAGFVSDQASKWVPAIAQAKVSEATTTSEALAAQRQLLEAAKASQVNANNALASAQKITEEETTIYNTAEDRERIARKIESQLLAGEDDPTVQQALQQYVSQLRRGKIDAAGIDF